VKSIRLYFICLISILLLCAGCSISNSAESKRYEHLIGTETIKYEEYVTLNVKVLSEPKYTHGTYRAFYAYMDENTEHKVYVYYNSRIIIRKIAPEEELVIRGYLISKSAEGTPVIHAIIIE